MTAQDSQPNNQISQSDDASALGRPQKTPNDLVTDWQEQVLTLMAQGGSRVEVMTLLGISKSLFYRWLEDEPDFSDTIKRGDQSCEAWWVKSGRENLKDRNFNFVGWYMNMKNRFGWKDRQDVTTNDQPISFVITRGESDGSTDQS